MNKLLSLTALILLSGCDYSDGDRTGVVTKISRKGIFCKTWEGEINSGGMKKLNVSSDDGNSTIQQTVPNTFNFTVEDTHADLIAKINTAMNSGERITLHFRQEILYWPCRSSSGYFVDSVK